MGGRRGIQTAGGTRRCHAAPCGRPLLRPASQAITICLEIAELPGVDRLTGWDDMGRACTTRAWELPEGTCTRMLTQPVLPLSRCR
jgi:hypothetical protein